MKLVVAVLETMWGWGHYTRRAPRFFPINRRNFSGKRLYRLVGENCRLLVTNACKELVTSPDQHGEPDPEWLEQNLLLLKPEVILVCGKVAQATYARTVWPSLASVKGTKVLHIPHPAARNYWTRAVITETAERIQKELL